MKKQRIFAVVMAAVMTLSMVACGEKQSDNTPTPTTAPTATTAPTQAPTEAPAPTEVPAPQNVTIADASITFEDGNMGFVDAYMQHARSANLELSLVDFNGSKAVKAVNTTGTSKAPFVAIDVASLFGADVAKIAGVEMVVGTSHDDGEFHAVSGKIYSWWGAERDDADLGKWSVYMAKKNPSIVSGKVPAGCEFVADAQNIIYISIETDNGATDAGVPATFYIDDIRFYDAAGNTLKPADTTVAFNWPAVDETDLSIKALANAVEFDGYGCTGGGWGQNGADFTQELLDALQPGTALEIDFQSADGTMWCVFPDAAAGWSRIADNGQATINDGKSKAQITYEQIVAVVGEDKANWGARLQFEAVTDWEVYGIRVGKPSDNVAMANPVAFDGYGCSGGGWGQNGADFTQELLDAIVPGTAVKVSYKSADGSMWLVFPDATAGWSRIAQGEAVCDGSTAYITYDQIVAVVGEDKANWGARMQFEAVTDWEVYGVEVGQFVKYPVMNSFVEFDGYATSGGGWGQNGADFTQELLDALVPGSIMEISYQSADGSMWVVLPDAAAGWSRCAQGTAICDGSKAYVTYEQIAAVVGEDKSTWGARLQFEAVTDWEVYGIRVGKYVAEAAADGGEEEAPAQLEDPLLQTADGTVAYTASKTWADTAWWTQLSMPKEEIIGTVNPEEISAIKFTADTAFVLGYKDVNGNWVQTENVEGERVIKTMELGDAWDMALALSKGDGVEYTVTWEVYTGGDKTVVYPEAPAEPEAPAIADPVITAADGKGTVVAADASWWTQIPLTKDELLAGVALENVTGFKFTGDTDFIIAYNDGASAWIQKEAASSFELTAADINFADDVYYFCFVLSKGDSVVYNLAWEVLTAGGAAAGTDTPAVEEPAADAVTGDFSGAYAGDYAAEWIPADAFAACTDGATVTINFDRPADRANQWWNFTLIKGDWSKYLDAGYFLGEAPAYSQYEFIEMGAEGNSYTFTLSKAALDQVKADGKLGLQTDGVIFNSYSVTPAK